ncbi:hypothetical protein VE23_07075 [Paenibacillus sp. D9]|uniref:hypothetical protein n=1 Tax=Paenibacillus sp. D9 TaxID=665792 RepID=UPI00061E9447|nr:hypothetical protein [Paenibacillus sp. D9]KKC46953.1 hypothetical protein VE23_07075 [Paenibacillus sp. D9]
MTFKERENEKNPDNDNVPDSLQGKSLEELWELLLGKDELIQEKAKYEARKLKPDYQEGAPNLLECVMCGCDEVKNVELDVPLKSNKVLLSVRVKYGAQCSNPNCLEKYYDSNALDAIKNIEYWLKMRKHHPRILPFHLLGKEAREETVRVMRGEENDDVE